MTRRLLILFALLAGLVAACGLTWSIAWQRGIDNLRRNAAVRVDRTANALKSTLERYESLPYLLAEHPFVQDVLVSPTAPNVERANRYLEDLNRHARATATYIIQADGLCVAASNWQEPESFVGAEYQFRPYFVDAVKGGVGRFFGIGTISHDPGYYISQPVRRDGKIVGVAVVKLNLEWFQGADAVRAADRHRRSRGDFSVVRAGLEIPHGAAIVRRGGRLDLSDAPVCAAGDSAVAGDDRTHARRRCADRAHRRRALCAALSRVAAGDGRARLATDHHGERRPVDTDARNAAIVTGFGYVTLCLLAFYWRMRRARVREMIRSRELLQRAYAELNQRVAERTADLSQANEQLKKEVSERTRAEQELRSAHDELIQASKLAALGQMAAGITHELNQPIGGVAWLLGQHAGVARTRRSGVGARES